MVGWVVGTRARPAGPVQHVFFSGNQARNAQPHAGSQELGGLRTPKSVGVLALARQAGFSRSQPISWSSRYLFRRSGSCLTFANRDSSAETDRPTNRFHPNRPGRRSTCPYAPATSAGDGGGDGAGDGANLSFLGGPDGERHQAAVAEARRHLGGGGKRGWLA